MGLSFRVLKLYSHGNHRKTQARKQHVSKNIVSLLEEGFELIHEELVSFSCEQVCLLLEGIMKEGSFSFLLLCRLLSFLSFSNCCQLDLCKDSTKKILLVLNDVTLGFMFGSLFFFYFLFVSLNSKI